MELADRVVLVTGGAGAIAGHVARKFAAAGAKVVLAGRKPGDAAALAAELGGVSIAGDVSTPDGANAMAKAALAACGRVDALVHTVGGFAAGKVLESPAELYRSMFDLNVGTLLNAVRAVVPLLVARGEGFVAGIASAPAWTGRGPGSGVYAASKSAVATLLRSLDADLAGTNVGVCVAFPMGVVDTAANRRDLPHADFSTWVDPDAIGDALVFAATRGARGRTVDLVIQPRR